MLQENAKSTDSATMRVGGDLLLQSQLVELPTDLRNLQLRFTEKMLKATIAEKALEQAVESAAGRFDAYA